MRELSVTPRTDLERLYREQGDRLWWALLGYSGDPEVASDAGAEAFAQALRGGERIREPLAWIWRVAFRVAAGELKRRRRESGGAREIAYELDRTGAAIVEALQRLSPRQRAAILLHHYAGYPVKEVAAILGSSPTTVSVHLHRARKRLAELLEAS